MNKVRHIVKSVEAESIAEEVGIEPGDELLEMQGRAVMDVFDYRFLLNDELLEILIRKPNGEEWELEIEKEENEDLGILFENDFMDSYRSCRNHCIFCFIDQMPPGMRETLYFKDDDSRLSFLQGNYVTLTNMGEKDLDRVIQYHLSPINISVQTMNPELRCKMLNNRFAGDIEKKLDRLYKAGITMNGQIVLCKNINDGNELDFTIQKLTKYLPLMESVSIVPVGLSKFREGLYPLEPFEPSDAREVLALVHSWQDKLYREYGTHFIHCSDEWYILADQELPKDENYDGYPQYENGVGMLRLLEQEIADALSRRQGDNRVRQLSIATGQLACKFLEKYIIMIKEKYPQVDVKVYPIRNDFFGTTITVSGLITGQDLIRQLKGEKLGELLLLPCNMLRSGEDVFLDDVTLDVIKEELQIPIHIVDEDGASLVDHILGEKPSDNTKRRQIYEQTDRSDCR